MNLNEQLRLLSIFHYVVGGLHALFASFGLIHFFIGLSIILYPAGWAEGNGGGPPPLFGFLFAGIGAVFVLAGWILGGLTILSGRFISRRVHRTFSIVMGAVNCALFPFGTVLGVFDIILLTKDETKQLYAGAAGVRPEGLE